MPPLLEIAVAAGLALALVLVLFLVFTAKRRTPVAQQSAPISELDDLRRRLADLEARPELAAPAASITDSRPDELPSVRVRPGMNLSRRSQALRLARRGESPEQIASILGLASGEVRLLLKIHGILMKQAIASPHGAALKPGQEFADILNSAHQTQTRVAKQV